MEDSGRGHQRRKGGSEMEGNSSPDGHGVAHRACQRCGAGLRRGRPGGVCDPCSRHPDIAGLLREVEFFSRELIQRVLAAYDFGYLFRAVRRTAELTQQELGELLGLDQDRISRIERGQRRLRDIVTVARVACRLGIPPGLLGFDPNAVSVERSTAGKSREEVDWVRRRDFSWVAAGALLGLGVSGLDIDRLAALLPGEPTRPPARIGAADVAAIEQATELFRSLGHSRGGGLCRSAAVAQLRSVLPLQDAACTAEVRERLRVATADLGKVAAWASYDAENHGDARRLWVIALGVAGQAEHPRVVDLTAHLLMDMAHQALHLRQPQEALNLIQLADANATRRNQTLSASTASHLASYQGWGQAVQHDARSCDRSLGQAVEHFARADPNTAAPWAAHITTAELAAMHGHAYYTLALATTDTQHAARALPLLQEAVDGFGPAYGRPRAVNLAGLAGAHALAGDLDTAARTGHHAVEEITALAAPRAYDRLRTLHAVLQPHASNPAIGVARNKIQTALAAV